MADAATKVGNAATQMNSAAGKTADAAGKLSDAADKADQTIDKVDQAAQKAADAANQANAAAQKANQSNQALQQTLSQQPLSRSRAKARKPPLDDYVPCLFDSVEESDLRALPEPSAQPMSLQDANRVVAALKAAVITAQSAAQSDKEDVRTRNTDLQDFANLLNPQQFIGLPHSSVPDVVKGLADKSGVSGFKAATVTLANAGSQASSIATFDRPDDVSCSFSILEWHETSDVFGRRVANDYVAIQVNIRNLNSQNEFLIHDVQIAVDTGLTPAQFGRFEAGRDKLIVRAVAQRGQTEDRRNLIANTLLMLGNMAAGASAAITQGASGGTSGQIGFAGNFSTAVAIFQGPFITGFTNIFPDHTIEYINHINDLTFSASSTSKTIVPTQGSVPLVTFLKTLPLEQLPFAHCGQFHFGLGKHDSNDKNDPRSAQYPACDIEDSAPQSVTPSYSSALHYKDWSPAAIRVLEERTFVVIAGVHIQELSSNPVQTLTCPPLSDGVSVDTSKVDSTGTISCSMQGSHLDKFASGKLEQGTATPIPVTVTSAADGNTATLRFKASDVVSATGDYELFLTDASGTDTDTKQKIHFSARTPSFSAPSVNYTPPPTATSATAYIYGMNLDLIGSVTLTDGTKTVPGTPQGAAITPDTKITQFTFNIPASTFASGATVHLTYTLKGDSSSKQNPIPNDPTAKMP